MKHIIIGGVAGGATAAARIRRADESADIVLLEKGKYISYANCGLPYYIGGVIADRDRLFLQTPASFSGQFNIDVRVCSEAVGIDPQAKTVTVRREDGSRIRKPTTNYCSRRVRAPSVRRWRVSPWTESLPCATSTIPTV